VINGGVDGREIERKNMRGVKGSRGKMIELQHQARRGHIYRERKMLNLQHQHNNHTTTPHMIVEGKVLEK
jgi:hypothetical protein